MIKYLKLGSLFVFTFEDMSVKVCCGVSLTGGAARVQSFAVKGFKRMA